MTRPNRPTQDDLPLHLRVFLASPGDVAEERAIARKVLDDLPYDPLLRGRVTFEVVAWDRPGAHAPMLATLTPQEAIARDLPTPSQCDIVIVIVWARMGTPLPADFRKPDGTPYLSGTEWEYLNALAAVPKPETLVYRRTEDPSLRQSDPEFDEKRRQWLLVQEFFAGFRNPDGSIKQGHNEYEKPDEFRQQITHHLKAIVGPLLRHRGASARVQPHVAATKAAPQLWQGSPFPGLRAFTPDDAPIFFGRGRETDALVRAVGDAPTRLVAVVGASGSGKSSLVAAGLLPRLAANALEGSKDWLLPDAASAGKGERKQWTALRFTPGELGDNPFVALAAKLAPLLPDDSMTPRTLTEHLEAQPAALPQLVDTALQGRGLRR